MHSDFTVGGASHILTIGSVLQPLPGPKRHALAQLETHRKDIPITTASDPQRGSTTRNGIKKVHGLGQ